MEFAFAWPMSQGEWLAWSSAAVTVLFGLIALFAPRTTLRILRLETRPDRPEAVAQSRASLAGFWLGIGLSCLLLAQPMLYLALGVAWGLTAFGRLISILSDDGNSLYNWLALAVEIVLAGLALSYSLGFVA